MPGFIVNAKYTTMASGTAMNATIIPDRAKRIHFVFFIGRHPCVRCMMWISSGPMFMPMSSPTCDACVEWMIHS